jgi:toxin ParE1/3/4
VKVSYRQTANDDLVRQFRYYLTVVDLPEVAIRFRDAARQTIQSLRQHPHVGPRCFSSNPRLHNLRAWPVVGFEAIRIYYLIDKDVIRVIRILHGKRDVKRILEEEGAGRDL